MLWCKYCHDYHYSCSLSSKWERCSGTGLLVNLREKSAIKQKFESFMCHRHKTMARTKQCKPCESISPQKCNTSKYKIMQRTSPAHEWWKEQEHQNNLVKNISTFQNLNVGLKKFDWKMVYGKIKIKRVMPTVRQHYKNAGN